MTDTTDTPQELTPLWDDYETEAAKLRHRLDAANAKVAELEAEMEKAKANYESIQSLYKEELLERNPYAYDSLYGDAQPGEAGQG